MTEEVVNYHTEPENRIKFISICRLFPELFHERLHLPGRFTFCILFKVQTPHNEGFRDVAQVKGVYVAAVIKAFEIAGVYRVCLFKICKCPPKIACLAIHGTLVIQGVGVIGP